ncbi:molybdopterin-binding domain-containing protein [Salisediminibacterium beveridgei]|uniref:Uncharacterized protein n=1 Tax=Salisediminibacterium beveridgei TaxID=632773 RepID=A0A1D7QSQ6_9BACI|nr:hypothetical protein [Salisediminibacterium beveridgei]AOM82046.1 hypothetical protein BBEV_0655 [Salisediminibacterium beveridgei]
MLNNLINDTIDFSAGLTAENPVDDPPKSIKTEEIIELTMTKRVPLSDSTAMNKMMIWITEPGRSHMISKMTQRWMREGKDVIVISDRTLPLPDGVTFHLVQQGTQGILASGLLNRLVNECRCKAEDIFATETMYGAYKELLRSYSERFVCQQTGLSEKAYLDLAHMVTNDHSIGFFFPHEEINCEHLQSFRAALLIPLVMQGCNNQLSLPVFLGNGRKQVVGISRDANRSMSRFQSIQNKNKKERSGKMTFAIYVDDIADRFEVDPFPLA